MTDRKMSNLSEEDQRLVQNTLSWCEEQKGENEYLFSLGVIARSGLTNARAKGFAASMIPTFQRERARELHKAQLESLPQHNTYLGSIGKKEEFTGILERVGGYSTAYGYTTVLTFRTEEGACLVWKASNTEVGREHIGKRFSVRGTIKAHEEYQGTKQTVMTRCKVTEG